ncbi:uncharacterized protein [Hemitrygon akajei]|uniref:uncharacterized protein isoform X1 n=1 Tax=Hemitrygon akajei TaxID=2704970 RepID=UPI003BF9938F
MESCNIHLYFQLSLALFAFVELAVGDEKELTVTVGGVETLSCLISRQLPYDRPVSWYWTAMYPECSGSTGGKILDIYPDGRTVFEEEFKGRVLVYRSRVKKGDYSITIRGIKIPDSGEFICAHEYLSDEKKVRLIVKPGCWSNLYLTVEPPVASIGDKVTLTCTYCGTKLVTPRIKWQYDGLAVSDTGVVSITNGGHSLVISHVDQEHLKKYGCSMAKKESIVTEICLNIETDFLDTTMFAGDYDYPVSTLISTTTSVSTTTSTTQEITTTMTPAPETTNASLNMWSDLEWMQDTSPVTSPKIQSSPTTIMDTIVTTETADPWNEDVIPDQLGSTEKLCPVTVNNGRSQFPTYMCIILGGILLLIIITFICKRCRGNCKFGTHDVEHNASNPNDDVPSSEVPETRDAVQMQSENDDNDAKGSTDGMNAGMQEPNKNEDEDENTSPIEMKEADVKDSSHVEESEDGKLQGDQQ